MGKKKRTFAELEMPPEMGSSFRSGKNIREDILKDAIHYNIRSRGLPRQK